MIDLPLTALAITPLGEGGAYRVECIRFRGDAVLESWIGELQRSARRVASLDGRQLSLSATPDPAAELLRFVGRGPLICHDRAAVHEHLESAGISLSNPTIGLSDALAIVAPVRSDGRDAVVGEDTAEAVMRRFLRLVDQVYALDLNTLTHVTRLAGPLDWPVKLVFAEAHRAKTRELVTSAQARAEAAAATGFSWERAQEPRSPITPHERSEPLDPEAISALLGSEGPLARAIPGFAERAEQRRMAEEVARAFNDGGALLVEAGTGTGKSMAYLVPAAVFAHHNDRRVVISTNTINLQDQLWAKDCPSVVRALGLPIRVAVLKGRANYLCLKRWLALLAGNQPSQAERTFLIKSLFWLPLTETGDRGELQLDEAEEEVWSRVAATTEACTPLRCRFHRDGTCFVARARRAAEAAHLVIVNHSLLMIDAMMGGSVVPEYSHVVLDEAHHLEDEATRQLSQRVGQRESARRLDGLAEATGASSVGLLADSLAVARQHLSPEAAQSVAQSVRRAETNVAELRVSIGAVFGLLVEALRAHAGRSTDGGPITLRITDGIRTQPIWSELDVCWAEAARPLLAVVQAVNEVSRSLEDLDQDDQRLDAVRAELLAQLEFWTATRQLLDAAISTPVEGQVCWLSLGETADLGVNAAPLLIADAIKRGLLGDCLAAVFTSATLTTEGSFQFIQDRLGLQDARCVSVGSPFDYREAAIVLVPSDAREPTDALFQADFERLIADVTTAVRGRTLVLFTSHAHLRATYRALLEPLRQRGVTLLAQGFDGLSRSRLVDEFRSERPTVLFGAASFWEGVDVVGDALSCLIVARLPFALPTDPVIEARSEQFEQPFSQYSLPQAVLRFRQGFGRLIRSTQDTGVMIVADGRLRTRRYRWAFLRSLPPCRVINRPLDQSAAIALRWFAHTAAAVAEAKATG
ncbi:MAG: helicase C-terminal domain-containing protein [Chloroflexota bacterium]